MAPGAPPGARGARNAPWKPYFALPGAAKIASGGLRERKINFVGAFRGALGRKVERLYPPGGSWEGPGEAPGPHSGSMFAARPAGTKKVRTIYIFLCSFDGFMLFLKLWDADFYVIFDILISSDVWDVLVWELKLFYI